ncbi:MAG: cob(I)yrinic acid a,c-diamide adenosyltransferase [Verrucomicrobiota bacterium]|nr:cob(I)yrinic acid a,c-diamide adenosyltransferase [Verrucomicrobiota bacterium]
MIILYTGNGKGKTTAALGLALRGIGNGWKVGMVQFIKNKTSTAEFKFAESANLSFDIFPMGDGFTWKTKNREDDIKTCKKIWKFIEDLISQKIYNVLILDEINIVLDLKYLDTAKVISVLENCPENMHIILTGRNAPQAIIDYADLVTEMKKIKHPFDKGQMALKGIDY